MCHFFVLLVAAALVAASVLTQSIRAAGNWYVSTNGNDTNDCRSAATACRTIAAAIQRAEPGDVVFVAVGVYTENLSFGKNLTVIGDASGTIIDGGGTDRVMEILGGRVSIQNVIIRNGGNGALEGPGGAIFNLGTLELQGTIIAQSYTNQAGGGIYNEGNLYLYMSTVSNNSARSCGGIFNTGTLDIVFTTPTRTHALLAGSPAIDAAPYTECPATDQQGVERPLDGNGDLRAVCDIGAFEYDTVPSAPPPLTPTSPPSPPTPTSAPTACRTNTGSWQNTRLGSLTGSFTATFDATPHRANMDGVIGLAKGSANDYEDLAAIVRFNAQGFLDARNGAEYQAASAVPYTAGTSYHFRLVVRVPQHTYDIFVTPANGAEQVIGTNFAFRAEQAGVTALDTLAVDARVGSHTVCNFAVAGGTAPPTPGQTVTPVPPGASPTPVPPFPTAVLGPPAFPPHRMYLPLAVR